MSDETKSLITAVLGLAKELVWPIFLGWVFIRLRPEITALLTRLASVKVGGNKVVFQGQMAPKGSDDAKGPASKKTALPSAAPTAENSDKKGVPRKEKVAHGPELDFEPGPDGFLSAVTIREMIGKFTLLDPGERAVAELLIFQTPEQKTWIVATQNYIFVLLDDVETRRGRRLIQTYFEKSRAMPIKTKLSDGAPIVKFAAEDIWWYYSEHLFGTPRELETAVGKLASVPAAVEGEPSSDRGERQIAGAA